jgi:hypothetical protein
MAGIVGSSNSTDKIITGAVLSSVRTIVSTFLIFKAS